MYQNVPSKLLSSVLLPLPFLPLLCTLLPRLPSPQLSLLLPLLDHIASAIFAARYLTFMADEPPYSPRNLYPFILPYAPLLQLSHSLFHTPESIKHTVLPRTDAPVRGYDACQARFTLFISSNALVVLTVLQVIYGVPRGVSHHIGLVLPSIVIVSREGCSVLTPAWIMLLAIFGNVVSLTYLIVTAIQALVEGISLERVLLATKGDRPHPVAGGEGEEGSPLFGKGDVSDVSEGVEVVASTEADECVTKA